MRSKYESTAHVALRPIDHIAPQSLGTLRSTNNTMCALLDRVSTPQGDIIILTKTRFYFFFTRPRTSVMPYRVSEFSRKPGFQAVYSTSDPDILAEFHAFFVGRVAAKGLESLMLGAKMGFMDFPPGQEHLRDYIVGFLA